MGEKLVAVVSVLLLVHSFVLLKVGSSPTGTKSSVVSLNWTKEAVAAVNNTIQIKLNGLLILQCASFSNVVIVNSAQFESCNASGADVRSLRGNCYSEETSVNLPIRDVTNELRGPFRFVAGETYYLTSFSAGNTFADSYSTHFVGGECTQGLKLVLEVLDNVVTTVAKPTRASTTELNSPEQVAEVFTDKPPSVSLPGGDQLEEDDDTPNVAHLELNSANGSKLLHSVSPLLVLLLVMASQALIR